MLFFALQSVSSPAGGNATVALLALIVAVGLWVGGRALARSLRARKTQSVVGVNYSDYALEALVNAAKIDGRVAEAEKRAILTAMREIEGAGFEAVKVEEALARAALSKNELVAYIAARANDFTRDQKAALLKGLLSVFVSDGRFDEIEHAALVDYTTAIGFDRQGAPALLRGFVRGSIT